MSTEIKFLNNYDKFKEDFKKDTGLNASNDVTSYIAYYHARISDMEYQLNFQALNLILNKIDFLPDTIRLRIAEMIREHEVIKEVVKLLKK